MNNIKNHYWKFAGIAIFLGAVSAFQNCANKSFTSLAGINSTDSAGSGSGATGTGTSSPQTTGPVQAPTSIIPGNTACLTVTNCNDTTTATQQNAFYGQIIVQPPSTYFGTSSSDLLFPSGATQAGYTIGGYDSKGGPFIGSTLFFRAANDLKTYIQNALVPGNSWLTPYTLTLNQMSITSQFVPSFPNGDQINQNGVRTPSTQLNQNPDSTTSLDKTPLANYFAISFQGLFQLDPAKDKSGYYQFLVMSDDGAVLAFEDSSATTGWTNLVSNMYFGKDTAAVPNIETVWPTAPLGTQWSLVGCTSKVSDQSAANIIPLQMTQGNPVRLRVDWYNYWLGMRLQVFYKFIGLTSTGASASRYCGMADQWSTDGSSGYGSLVGGCAANTSDQDCLQKSLEADGWSLIGPNNLAPFDRFTPLQAPLQEN